MSFLVCLSSCAFLCLCNVLAIVMSPNLYTADPSAGVMQSLLVSQWIGNLTVNMLRWRMAVKHGYTKDFDTEIKYGKM